jgi:hypothetical protein
MNNPSLIFKLTHSTHPLILHNSAEKAIMRGLYRREETPMSLHARIHFINFARKLTVTSISNIDRIIRICVLSPAGMSRYTPTA